MKAGSTISFSKPRHLKFQNVHYLNKHGICHINSHFVCKVIIRLIETTRSRTEKIVKTPIDINEF